MLENVIMDLGSLKMTLIVLKFLSPSFQNQVDLYCEYGLGENLAFENLWYFKIWNQIVCVFFFG